MWRLINFLERDTPSIETPVLQMKMVKEVDELTWHELRTHAKAKGIKTHGKKRQQILKELNG
jgi:hypothetical protein